MELEEKQREGVVCAEACKTASASESARGESASVGGEFGPM